MMKILILVFLSFSALANDLVFQTQVGDRTTRFSLDKRQNILTLYRNEHKSLQRKLHPEDVQYLETLMTSQQDSVFKTCPREEVQVRVADRQVFRGCLFGESKSSRQMRRIANLLAVAIQ